MDYCWTMDLMSHFWWVLSISWVTWPYNNRNWSANGTAVLSATDQSEPELQSIQSPLALDREGGGGTGQSRGGLAGSLSCIETLDLATCDQENIPVTSKKFSFITNHEGLLFSFNICDCNQCVCLPSEMWKKKEIERIKKVLNRSTGEKFPRTGATVVCQLQWTCLRTSWWGQL